MRGHASPAGSDHEPVPPLPTARARSNSHTRRHPALICPDCGGHKIRRSRPKGLLEVTVLPFFVRPFRCEECDLRFYRPTAHLSFFSED